MQGHLTKCAVSSLSPLKRYFADSSGILDITVEIYPCFFVSAKKFRYVESPAIATFQQQIREFPFISYQSLIRMASTNRLPCYVLQIVQIENLPLSFTSIKHKRNILSNCLHRLSQTHRLTHGRSVCLCVCVFVVVSYRIFIPRLLVGSALPRLRRLYPQRFEGL